MDFHEDRFSVLRTTSLYKKIKISEPLFVYVICVCIISNDLRSDTASSYDGFRFSRNRGCT